MNPKPMFTLGQCLPWLEGASLVGEARTPIGRVHTDTRTLQSGDLFVALRGERFDAHDFLAQASASGAVAAIADHGLAEAGLPGLIVPDTRLALGELARHWRMHWDAHATRPLIAITGSNGKTTVTQMVAAILRAHAGEQSLATQGNLNNDIGVPMTLLRLRAAHRCAVVELGMNHPGEIGYLARMAQPTVALVNNAQREHQEFMASVEAVARENGSVFAALPPSGTAVFPAHDPYTGLWQQMAAGHPTLCFGWEPSADVHGHAIWQQAHWQVQARTPAGDLRYTLRIAGRHNVLNSLAATACAVAAHVPLTAIAQGLSEFEAVKGRSRTLALTGDKTLIDDSYNANPDSVRAAIDVLADLPGPRLLVLGDMGEVGDQGPAFHAEVGEYAMACGIEHVLCLGDLMRHAATAQASIQHFKDMESLLAHVRALYPTCASILVKGSRFMKMERVVEQLLHFDKGQAHAA
jgi:UDP-N-acetylmuramoyl-tripeptide--D-alanyl-D-alanine ligase